ncbi:GNAT family N-acetyltransferase [Alkalihalophilus marmarensis]|uniref:GNAT family N-acetyltransferase n=1 Tax=Alkalihalophilus marmarensis TaxID=521377 RepID=UPI0004CFD439|nr:GNAT family protein [Alkalihalophilus marmarensis]MCM3488216.1 GNAT family N-acetyltransferase [Alkalihalophilus marmarensis]
MKTELVTERLCLRKMDESDAGSLFEIWSDPEVTKYMNISSFTEIKQAEEMISLLNQLANENQAIRYSMIELTSNKVIGSCGFNVIDFKNERVEIGYDLSKSYWGKGFATEALTGLLLYAFETLAIHRVEAKVEPANLASIRLLNKLQFSYEGTLRQSEKARGSFVDLAIYSRLSTD